MASYQYPPSHFAQNSASSQQHNGHHGRSRRGPRIASQNAHRQPFKPQRSPKSTPEIPAHSDYLRYLEAAKGFEFDDDEIFCPFNLLTEDDLQSIYSSSSSEKGSLSSGSPETSPIQQQVQPTPSLLLSAAPYNMNSSYSHHNHHTAAHHQMKLHQPLAQRTRNAIPIVDPSTRSVASPPISVSPARGMQQQFAQRRW